MQINRRFWEVMLGILFLTTGFAVVNDGVLPAWLLVGMGAYLLWRQFDASRVFSPPSNERVRARRSLDDDYESDTDEPPSSGEKIYAQALRAVERAGLNPNEVQVLPVDIGVMASRKGEPPAVYRKTIMEEVDYIHPFVQLRLPKKAVGRIKFELLDGDGQILFVREDTHQLERGRNLVTPPARLPIHDGHMLQKNWQLRVSADGMLLAKHEFGWQESEERKLRRHLGEDGEINSAVRQAIAEDRLQDKISLDDLLSYQDGDSDVRQQRR
jgi:hypothetical protein